MFTFTTDGIVVENVILYNLVYDLFSLFSFFLYYFWKRYEDDTFVVIEAAKKEGFLEHISSVEPHIHFTTEDAKADGSIPFLDTIVMSQPDNSLLTSVYRKPTHTDLYLNWNIHHHLSAKFSVINTLKHRAKIVCSNNQLLKEEVDHLNRALRRCKYPEWALSRANIKQKKKTSTNQGTSSNSNWTGSNNKPYIVVPYIQGMSESYKNICRKHGVEMFFRGGNTIKGLLMQPKDRDNILQKSGVICRFRCGRVNCDEEYIGELGRTFTERFRKHMKASSPIHDHHNITGCEVSLDNFSILGREDQNITRTIKEEILIRVNDPSLNRNIGKYQLQHIWDEVLAKSPELKLNTITPGYGDPLTHT